MEGKDLKEFIEEQTKDIEVPDSLQPENIEKMLEEKGKKRRNRYYKKVLGAAACCVIIVGISAAGIGGLFGRTGKQTDSSAGNAVVSGTADSGDTQKSKNGTIRPAEEIQTAGSYDEVYRYIKAEYKRQKQASRSFGSWLEVKEEASATDSAANGSTADSGASGYSDTNVREEGVGEADIVKTDGKRLYILNSPRIQIVDIGQDVMKQLGAVEMEEEDYISELYIKDDKLIVVYTRVEYEDQGDVDSGEYGGIYKEYTVAETFDVSNPEKPKSLGKISQSGNYYTMRVVGDYVYLFSNFYADISSDKDHIIGYIPEVQGKSLAENDILMPGYTNGSQYTVVSSFSLANPEEKVDSKAIFGGSGLCYVSGSNIYVCESDYGAEDSDVTQTCIRKVAYKDGMLEAVGQTRIDGTLNDSFSIDEYDGKLRLVTTVSPVNENSAVPFSWFRSADRPEEGQEQGKDSNSLYILDEGLNELSRIDGLAEDERVYSARFMGDTGYFVTYRQMDPLFSVDLSDPEKPEIIGALKIPGFSEYLHPYGEGLLLGIGMDADETGTTTNGVKLSMFDISDPSDVKEVQKYVLEDIYSTEVAYNYKSALVDTEKNLIGFPACGEDQHYYIFSYDKDGFSCVMDRTLSGHYSEIRALYVGDILYLAAGNTIESYSLDTFEKLDDIVL